jgi:hypothetical protein
LGILLRVWRSDNTRARVSDSDGPPQSTCPGPAR